MTGWMRYRKTATTPMAWCETHADVENALDQLAGYLGVSAWGHKFEPQNTPGPHARIHTREGPLTIDYPFWLALDAQGGLYPIAPDAFDASYDHVPTGPFAKVEAARCDCFPVDGKHKAGCPTIGNLGDA